MLSCIEQVNGLGGNARPLVPQHGDRALPGGRQIGQPDCLVGQLDANDAISGRPLIPQPPAEPGQSSQRPGHGR
jgi:hypothetical protein